jgi:hypothetical protein
MTTTPTPSDATPADDATTTPADATPADADTPTGNGTGRVSPRAARIVGRGRGNWYRATTRRIVPDAAGFGTPDDADRAGGVRVRMSPAADAAVAAVAAAHMSDDAAVVAIHAAASAFASARGSRRVWDIDVAAAIGFPWTPDGASAFRAAYGIAARSVAASWPARVAETPYPDTPRGPVVDPATGRVVTPATA